MKRFTGLIVMLLVLLAPCLADTTAKNPVNGTPGSYAPPVPPIPGADSYSTPHPSVATPPPVSYAATPEPRTDPKFEFLYIIEHNTVSVIIAIVALLINFFLGVWVLVSFFSIKERGNTEMKAALQAALFITISLLTARLLRTVPSNPVSIVVLFFGYSISYLRYFVAVYVGIHLWRDLGNDYWGLAFWKEHRARVLGVSMVATGVAVIYSTLLFSWLHPSSGWAVKMLFGTNRGGSGFRGAVSALLLASNFAFAEEFVYRGCFQSLITSMLPASKVNSWRAIIIVALVWTIGHAGSLSPDWVKFVQVFPLGVFLGWWYGRAGYIGSVTVHIAFNIIISLFAGHFITSS
jgi:membrane protease YdiL (CAAX protease family)